MSGCSCMNCLSCCATRVPSAPRALPENVRTVLPSSLVPRVPVPHAASMSIANVVNVGRSAHRASMYEGSKRFGGLSGLSRTRVNASAHARTLSFFCFNNKKTPHAEQRSACIRASSETIRIIRGIRMKLPSWAPELREHELHRQIGDIPELNVSGGTVTNRVQASPGDLVAPQLSVLETGRLHGFTRSAQRLAQLVHIGRPGRIAGAPVAIHRRVYLTRQAQHEEVHLAPPDNAR